MSSPFSIDEYGFEEIPIKFSNVQLSRIQNGGEMGCSYCFPHGMDTVNSRWKNRQRSWKSYRHTKWKAP